MSGLAVCVDVAHLKRDFSRSRPLCDLLQSLHKARAAASWLTIHYTQQLCAMLLLNNKVAFVFLGCMVCQIFSAHLNKGERAYLKNIPRILYKAEVDMAEEFINNEHQLQKSQKVMVNSTDSTAAISHKDEKNEDLKEINGKDEAEASGDGLTDLPTIMPTTSLETVSVEPSNDDDTTMVNLTQSEMHNKTEEKNN
ncbi:hypothetical protein T4E_9955 [Trichinella pseudospiralis]|uniref:Uncharacterized protein n=3 Tax=Trichinella pseudospiralis TaxID=6337 RepID=A0A0V0XUX5_TRIPS|nr:hypothetical protein T4E_9955 [Trichinella pseudospiralis]